MLDELWVHIQGIEDLSSPTQCYNALRRVVGIGPYRGKSALLMYAAHWAQTPLDSIEGMSIIPMASGPRRSLSRLSGIPLKEIGSEKVTTLILEDVWRALVKIWPRGPWQPVSTGPGRHQLACQLCQWARDKFGKRVGKTRCIFAAIAMI